MLAGVCIGTNGLVTTTEFHHGVLATIRPDCVLSESRERGYAGADGKISLFVILPFDEQAVTFGNGTQVMFTALNPSPITSQLRNDPSAVLFLRTRQQGQRH